MRKCALRLRLRAPEFIPVIYLWGGLAFCYGLVASLYDAYFGGVAYFLGVAQAWAAGHLVLSPLGWQTTLRDNSIVLSYGQVNVVLECLAPEVLLALVVIVALFSSDRRHFWRGLLLCPFMFWCFNTLRIAFLAVVASKWPSRVSLFHGGSFDLALLAFAAVCLWFWLQRQGKASPSVSKLFAWLSFFLLKLLAFYLVALALKSGFRERYCDFLFAAAGFSGNTFVLPGMLDFRHACVPLAMIWSFPVNFTTKLSATAAIIAFRLGIDIYLCHAFVRCCFVEVSAARGAEVLVIRCTLLFCSTVFIATAWVAMCAFRSYGGKRGENYEIAKKPVVFTLAFHPEILLFPLLAFAFAPFFTVEEALWVNLLCLCGWLFFSRLLRGLRRRIRLPVIAAICVLVFFCRGLFVPLQAYEQRAYLLVIERRYSRALCVLNSALARPAGEKPPRIYLQRALCRLVRGCPESARADIVIAGKRGGLRECSVVEELCSHLAGEKPDIIGEIVASELEKLFSKDTRETWQAQRATIERERIAKARRSIRRRLERNPGDADAWWRSGFLDFREDNYYRALDSFDRTIDLDPSHLLARHYRALIFLRHCRYRDAQRELSAEITANPGDISALYLRAESYRAQGNYQAARQDCRKVSALSTFPPCDNR